MSVPFRPLRITLIAATTLLVAACAVASPSASPPGASSGPVPAATGPTPSGSPSTGASALLIEVTTEGGFINPIASLGAVPQVVVEADGRLFTPGSPGGPAVAPLVTPVNVRDLGPVGAAAIQAAIRDAGLDREGPGGGIAADTGSTVFTVELGGDTIVNRFAAGGGPGGPGLPGGPEGAGGTGGAAGGSAGASGDAGPAAAAFALLSRLTDPTETWGGGAAPATPYRPAGFRVYVAPAGPPADAASGAPAVARPLEVDLAGFGVPAVPDLGTPGLRSGIVLGDDAARLAVIADTLPAGTPFTWAGRSWQVWIRPLLPNELDG